MLLHLFDIANFRNHALIDHKNGDVESLYIRTNKRAPNILKIKINTSFAQYNIVANRQDFGIRVQDGDQDMLFIFRDREIDDLGVITLEMPSYVYKLLTTPLNNLNRVLDGYSLSTFLGDLDTEFLFTPIGSDRNIDIITGSNDNLKLLTEAITYPDFFDWVDAGLKDDGGLKPNIVYGDFRQIESYFDSSADARFTPLKYNVATNTDNINDPNQLYFEDVIIKTGKEAAQYIFPYVDTGMGFTQATTVRLNRTDYSFVNPQFPIVKQTATITGEDYYCVVNPFAPSNNKTQVYEYDYPSNTQDNTGSFETTLEITEEVLYKRCIAYIQSLKTKPTLKLSPAFKKLILAGTLARVQYKRTIRNYDGSELYTQDYTGDYILDNMDIDINTFA